MTLEFDSSVTTHMSDRINLELKQVEEEHDVKIIFAVESGSRAWGFPSPDSDYDARFVYAHRRDWYLSLNPGRDVIELPIDNELDINGWDIRKAINLMLKPNPVLLEWLSSPIRYIWEEVYCTKLIQLCRKVSHAKACTYHYLHMVQRQEGLMSTNSDMVNLKKYFYSIRPALVLRWIRENPESPPPMNLQALMEGVHTSADLDRAIESLLKAKKNTREMGLGKRIPVIEELLAKEKEWAENVDIAVSAGPKTLHNDANLLFREIVEKI